MKICNLILLNFCFYKHFPLLFGMHPGEGSGSQSGGVHLGEGSQQPVELDAFTQLNNEIRPMLYIVGGSAPYADTIRPIENTEEHVQPATNVGEQYNNFAYVYTELSNQFNKINSDLQKYLIHERQNVLMADMKKILAYVRQHYNDYIAMQNTGWLNFGGGSGSQSGGMNPEENPSVSKQLLDFERNYSKLNEKIRLLLPEFGNSEPDPLIILRHSRNNQVIDTVEKQYLNIRSAYERSRLLPIPDEQVKIIEDMQKIHKQLQKAKRRRQNAEAKRRQRQREREAGNRESGSNN